jgi:uncharacterized membrane protein YdbT with pleckstrin-like domain
MHDRKSSIEKVDDDEIKLAEVFKHPIYIVFLYLQVIVGVIVSGGLAYFLLPTVLGSVDTGIAIANAFVAIAIILAFLIIVVATYIFRQNRLTITDRNITQVLQSGLFNRKVSQLNINNVEDVTAVQNGFLQTIFNYGSLNIETAGEQVNFHYTFCPNPGFYAKIILDAREKMLGQMEEEKKHDAYHHEHAPEQRTAVAQTQENTTTSQAKQEPARTSADDAPETLKGIGAEMLRQAKKN